MQWRRARLTFSLALAFAGAGADVANEYRLPPGLTGLLTVPLAAEGPPRCLRADTTQRLVLRNAPSCQAAERGLLQFVPWGDHPEACDLALPTFQAQGDAPVQDVPTLESGYEEMALPVLEQQGDWYRLAIGDDDAWLKAPAGFRYQAYPELLQEKLGYMTTSWEGELCAAPGQACRRFDPALEQAVSVHESRAVDGTAWLRVEIFDAWCRETQPARLAQGWIRARAADRRPTVWFHSRGC